MMEMIGKGLFFIFIILTVNQLVHVYIRIVLRKKGFSNVPIFVSLIGCLSLFLIDKELFVKYWWFPLIIDWGTIPLVIELIIVRLLNNNANKKQVEYGAVKLMSVKKKDRTGSNK